jgi:hypothetical protein
MKMNIKMMVLPAGCENLVKLIARAVRQRKVGWNYMVSWKDVHGVGIYLSTSSSLGNQTYVSLYGYRP